MKESVAVDGGGGDRKHTSLSLGKRLAAQEHTSKRQKMDHTLRVARKETRFVLSRLLGAKQIIFQRQRDLCSNEDERSLPNRLKLNGPVSLENRRVPTPPAPYQSSLARTRTLDQVIPPSSFEGRTEEARRRKPQQQQHLINSIHGGCPEGQGSGETTSQLDGSRTKSSQQCEDFRAIEKHERGSRGQALNVFQG